MESTVVTSIAKEVYKLYTMIEQETVLERVTGYFDNSNELVIFIASEVTLSISNNFESSKFTILFTNKYKVVRQTNITFALAKTLILKIINCLKTNNLEQLDRCSLCNSKNIENTLVCFDCHNVAKQI